MADIYQNRMKQLGEDKVGYVDHDGNIIKYSKKLSDPETCIGYIDEDLKIYQYNGPLSNIKCGYISSTYGTIRDSSNRVVGKIDQYGRIYDSNNQRIGHVEPNDVRAGAAVALGLFNGTWKSCIKRYAINLKERQPEQRKTTDENRTASGNTASGSTVGGVALVAILVFIIMGLGTLHEWINDNYIYAKFRTLMDSSVTQWIVGLAACLPILFVSISGSARKLTAIAESIVGLIVFGNFWNIYYYFPGIIAIVFVLLIPLLEALCFKMGSSAGSSLRQNYMKLNRIQTKAICVMASFDFVLSTMTGQGWWNATVVCVIFLIIVYFVSKLLTKAQEMIFQTVG